MSSKKTVAEATVFVILGRSNVHAPADQGLAQGGHIHIVDADTVLGTHGGGDTGIMIDLLSLLRGETPSNSICEVRTSYENHLIGFAAEKARLENRVVSMEDFDKEL